VSQQTEEFTGVRPALPRVNLLPGEILVARRLRRVRYGIGGALLAALGVLALLYVGAVGQVNDAQQDLDGAQASRAQLTSDVAKMADVRQVYAEVATNEAMLRSALGSEILWSQYLNDLSLTIPDSVWLTSMTVTRQAVPAAGTTGSTPATAGIAGVTFEGTAFSHDDVANWLESLAKQKGYANPYFSKSEEDFLGSRRVVTFDTTVSVTPDALSPRAGS